jgi:hypothetical protein
VSYQITLAALERTIVEFLDAAGCDCKAEEGEWILTAGEDNEVSITALAIVILTERERP